MDTNLKKMRKLKNFIIALIVLIPALVLTSLYPQMERAMLDKKAQWLSDWTKNKEYYETELVKGETDYAASKEDEVVRYYLQDNFINYVVETSYYQHAILQQQATGEESYIKVLDHYGWINDYFQLIEKTPYYVRYGQRDESGAEAEYILAEPRSDMSKEEMNQLLSGDGLDEIRQIQLTAKGYLGYLYIEYDSYGKLVNIRLNVGENVIYDANLYERARASVEQYRVNAEIYISENEGGNAYMSDAAFDILPRNFQAVYLICSDNPIFVTSEQDAAQNAYDNNPYEQEPYYAAEDLYLATGAYWIMAGLAIFVFLGAMILPVFKKLETGWEKLFSIPFEIMLLVAAAGIALAFGMCVLMSHTTMTELTTLIVEYRNSIELLGYKFSTGECYNMLLGVNFLGWALAFFLEYICTAHLRQFFARPKYYIRHRVLGIRLICWIHKKIKKLAAYVLDIDINEKMHSSIVKIVMANGVIAVLLCCIWFAGILGVVIYSIILYVLMKKYGSKLQKQYQSILHATGQMADGNLQISLEEDLGIFEPLGNELEGVQQGFAKAVAEEAKSQNMKSELITNVSHDLKTPLTAIITYVDLLKNENITEEERKAYIETLDMKSQRLKVLIEDLFEVSKASSGNVQMNFMDVDVVKLLKEVRVELSDKIDQSNLDFRWKLPEGKVILNLDGQRTYRIFENILNNAIKYAMPFTRVYVELEEQESEVVITFKNVSAQELKVDVDYLTERFVRGDSSRNSEGSGLGLAIAKSFTELQNGQFEIGVDGDLFKVCIRFSK